MKTSKIIIKRWIEYAEGDLKSAEILFKSRSKKADKSRFRLVIWLCHQSIEKILKGVITANGKAISFIHDLVQLSEDAKVDLSAEQKYFIEQLNGYYIPPRYPDLHYNKPLPPFTVKAANHYLKNTTLLFQWLKKILIPKKSS